MNILMMTNTYAPHVGGVARSVEGFAGAFRAHGHQVLVAAPLFKGTPENERGVIRFPAVKDFNGSAFSVPMPAPLRLVAALKQFRPEIIHSHHPFLLGGTALRVAAARRLPVVFTYHTMYEKYTHYVPGDSQTMKHFVVDLVSGYCNLCDAVIAPSRTVAELLRERGVESPIQVIPTGINLPLFAGGDGQAFRRKYGIPARAFVLGHAGRLAAEKNLGFLTEAGIRFLEGNANAYCLIVGSGPASDDLQTRFTRAGFAERLILTGALDQRDLSDAYQAMDVFAFASHTETQGMVLAEAMCAGVPVVALDASGVREMLRDEDNGRLLKREDPECFVAALAWVAALGAEARQRLREGAQRTASAFEMSGTAARALDLYASVLATAPTQRMRDHTLWDIAFRRLRGEWRILRNVVQAAGDSLRPSLVWEVGPRGTEDPRAWPSQNALAGAENHSGMGSEPSATGANFKTRLLGWLWAWLLRLQSVTWRKRYDGLDRLDEILDQHQRVLFCFWHGKYLPLFALMRGRPACVFTSQSDRGAIIAEICRHFGYECVQVPIRGRSHAFEIMRRALERRPNGGIAVDGPLGPYHKVKRGAVKLAAELGYVVVPASATARRKRIIKHRWDRMEIPALFTRIGLAIGEPKKIPCNLSPEQSQEWVAWLREQLETLDRRAEELAGVPKQKPRMHAERGSKLLSEQEG